MHFLIVLIASPLLLSLSAASFTYCTEPNWTGHCSTKNPIRGKPFVMFEAQPYYKNITSIKVESDTICHLIDNVGGTVSVKTVLPPGRSDLNSIGWAARAVGVSCKTQNQRNTWLVSYG
jgi:hypothetical protein